MPKPNTHVTAPTLHILAGPTAVGKSEHALAWAEQNNAEILSCDSLQLYRGLDIGTAKPSADERTRVNHELIDIADLDHVVTVREYAQRALEAAHAILGRGRNIIVAGGSGFYLQVFYQAVTDTVPPDPAIRDTVRSLHRTGGLPALLERLQALHPQGWQVALDTHNPRRVATALERCLTSGKTLDVLYAEFQRQKGFFDDFRKSTCLLVRSPDTLAKRIQTRTRRMLKSGLIEEVMSMRQRGLVQHPAASRAVGYRQVLQYLDGEIPRSELEQSINRATIQLAAKQRKWFRNQLKVDQCLDLDHAGINQTLFPQCQP